jgi:ATP-dependent helicase/nuclease subunit B
LRPERVAAPSQVSVTSLRAWLECPLRFYLSRVLKMQPVDPAKTELDEFDFGILCHAALEAMGNAPALRDCTDAKAIREFLLAALDRDAAKRFGRELTLPLVVQLESARQRLSRAAEVQAQSRAEGWVIAFVERAFEIDVGGLTVRGKIDRIDRHEATGAIRVLDYKTSDKPVNPAEAHVRWARRDETAREFARFPEGDRECVWRDLQLPLYLRALAAEFPGEISCGYFNLPKAATETGIARWDDYTHELAESAWRCAEGVAAAIRAGDFWPPNENIRAEQDDFASLFHGGVAESVAWEDRTR